MPLTPVADGPAPALTADAALLLDVDGTLIDIALTPDGVVVPQGLAATLTRLRDALGGALAFVSGRPIADLDTLFPGVATAVAGEHGGAIRLTPDGAVHRSGAVVPQAWREAAERLAAGVPGSLIEHKPGGIGLHFRGAPAAGPAFRAFADARVAEDPRFVVLASKMAWEIKPAGVDKGAAVRTLMAAAPFVGRVPVFLGDDVTDFPAIEAARALGGAGLFVPEVFGGAQGVRDWLAGSDP